MIFLKPGFDIGILYNIRIGRYNACRAEGDHFAQSQDLNVFFGSFILIYIDLWFRK